MVKVTVLYNLPPGTDEAEFLRRTEGSPIRRIGHERWLRNVSVAAGNALRQRADPALREALSARLAHSSELVREHAAWALAQDAERERQAEKAEQG